ncbi:hypothetical protein LJC45_05980 [Alistipes sp. OttesenSCG-928-B03]|nr:hypothetical protein [Alistipes sp. OttesenSCG-928-B03]
MQDATWHPIYLFFFGKIYPTNLTDQLIGLLSWQYDRVFVFGGGPYEQEFAEYMAQRHKGVVSVIGKVKLDAELDLMANLDAMVSMDSTTMHMASLVGIPVISVWGATARASTAPPRYDTG